MATYITDACINCGACEPVCPNHASSATEYLYVIDPDLCTECVGFHDREQCQSVCRVVCCLPDPEIRVSESELIEPFQKEVLFAAKSEDVAQRKCWSGKTVRMIKSQLSEAWERTDAPKPLQAPLQAVLWNPAQARIVRARNKDYFSYPAGQGVQDLTEERTVKDVMYQLQVEYAEALERMSALTN